MRVTIVSSNIKETFPQDGKTIFMGGWCLKYSEKSMENFDYEIHNYHWNQPNRFYGDIEFLDEVYKEYLVKITNILNKIHGTNYSIRYWNIQIGWWLIFFIQVLFDRWTSAHRISLEHPNAEIYKLQLQTKCPSASNSRTFFELAANDEIWNERLSTDIFENFTSLKINYVSKINFSQQTQAKKRYSFFLPVILVKINALLKEMIFKVIFFLTTQLLKIIYGKKMRSISLETTYLNRISLLRLFILLRSAPRFFRSWNIASLESSEKMRNWDFPNSQSSDFSKVLEYFLPKHIPRNFLEGFQINREKCYKLIKEFNPEILVTANDFADNDAWKFWAAECIENGATLLISQHGGSYGIAKYSSTQKYEVCISDYFLSWGWENKIDPKIVRAPAMKLLAMKQFTPINSGYCLLVTASFPRRSYHLGSWPIGAQLENYIQDQFDFVENLSDVVRRSLAVRLFPNDLGWEHALRWQDYNKEIELLPISKDLNSYLESTKLYISTYNATTFLEAFKSNIPTVIFWDPNFWEINEDAQYYFKILAEAKIFFDNPEEAAEHVNNIWSDVPLWWNSKEVRLAISKFSNQYAYTGLNPLRELSVAILSQK